MMKTKTKLGLILIYRLLREGCVAGFAHSTLYKDLPWTSLNRGL